MVEGTPNSITLRRTARDLGEYTTDDKGRTKSTPLVHVVVKKSEGMALPKTESRDSFMVNIQIMIVSIFANLFVCFFFQISAYVERVRRLLVRRNIPRIPVRAYEMFSSFGRGRAPQAPRHDMHHAMGEPNTEPPNSRM